jgi:hypothetical protein
MEDLKQNSVYWGIKLMISYGSAFLQGSMGLYMLHVKHFKLHPYPIIAHFCLFDSIFYHSYLFNIVLALPGILELVTLTHETPSLIFHKGVTEWWAEIHDSNLLDFKATFQMLLRSWKMMALVSVMMSLTI